MKLISWNVNGLRACVDKGFMGFLGQTDADIFCVQETKMQQDQAEFLFDGYTQYWNSAEKKGYSGTLVLTKNKPLSISYEMEGFGGEGRMVTLEFDTFFLVNVYTPNSKRELERLDYRMQWEAAFLQYITKLDNKKPVIICGDLNVAHNEIDLKNPKTNRKNAGFTDQERDKLSNLLAAGFTDSFRYLYPDRTGAYSWWSYMYNARKNNAGWRIDYFLCSDRIKQNICDAKIYTDVIGSDHCPVGLDIKL